MPNDALQVSQQTDIRAMIEPFLQLAFSIGVAWYLLTRTTDAINRLADRAEAIDTDLKEVRKSVEHQGTNMRQELRGLADAVRRHP